MSGGFWDYIQGRMQHIAIDINTESKRRTWNPETMAMFKEAQRAVKIAAIYVENIDLLLCDDADEESFIRMTAKELAKYKQRQTDDSQ
jgi:hypothetical protein